MEIYRDPAYNGIPVQRYNPVTSNEISFLDVTEDSLVFGRSPNGFSKEFMDYIVAKTKILIAINEKFPPTPEFELVCDKINEMNQKT